MKVLVAGSTGALGVPLLRALAAGGHEVAGLTRNRANRDQLRALGARPLIADVLDRTALLRAVDGLTVDAVVHLATAFRDMPCAITAWRPPTRCGPRGPPTCWRPPARSAPAGSWPSR
jgi:nucleoside-diphosphate-sugar epimerase